MIQLERHQPGTPEKSPNLGTPSSKSNGTLGVPRQGVMFVKQVSGAGVMRGLGRDMVEGDWGSGHRFQAAEEWAGNTSPGMHVRLQCLLCSGKWFY